MGEESRFVYTCAQRYCQNRGFSDGRIVEYDATNAATECYKDPFGLFETITATVSAVATGCIDGANPLTPHHDFA